jgi:hypothetical protein
MATTRLCKYHGRACEFPGACLNRAPRKYDADGYEERIDPERLTLGNVVRMKTLGIPAFSDNVVLRITVHYYGKRQTEKRREYDVYDTLGEALESATKDDYVSVKLARPYMYEHIGGPLMGCENYEIDGRRMLDTHKVVVQSTGEYDRRTATFSTTYQEVRQAEEARAAENPHTMYHTHNGTSGFPHTCPACRRERDKLVKG